MTISLDLQPEIESGLVAQATARGLSLTDYLKEIVVREAHIPPPFPTSTHAAQAKTPIELFEPVRQLLTEQEVDAIFSRNPSYSRPVDFE